MKNHVWKYYFCTSSIVQKNVLDKVKDSTFYSVMIDESTDIIVTNQLVVSVTFVD